MIEHVKVPENPEVKKKIVDGFNFLGLENFVYLITGIKFSVWGGTVLVDCIDQPTYQLGYQLGYRIVFLNCDKIKWSMNDSDSANEIVADIVDFQIKKEGEREYAYFYTDIFELLIYYGSINIEKKWHLNF